MYNSCMYAHKNTRRSPSMEHIYTYVNTVLYYITYLHVFERKGAVDDATYLYHSVRIRYTSTPRSRTIFWEYNGAVFISLSKYITTRSTIFWEYNGAVLISLYKYITTRWTIFWEYNGAVLISLSKYITTRWTIFWEYNGAVLISLSGAKKSGVR